MTVRQQFQVPAETLANGTPSLANSPQLRADWDAAAHRGERNANPCTYLVHEENHPATVRLTPDPDPVLVATGNPHTDQKTVCQCCAFQRGHLYEEMANQVRRGGDVVVELRREDGKWT